MLGLDHTEVLIADVRGLTVGLAFQCQLVIPGCQIAGGNVKRNRIIAIRAPACETAPHNYLSAAAGLKLGAESRKLVPGFQLNLYIHELRARSKGELLDACLASRHAGQENERGRQRGAIRTWRRLLRIDCVRLLAELPTQCPLLVLEVAALRFERRNARLQRRVLEPQPRGAG